MRLPEPQLARLARCGAQERQALLARGFRRAGLRPHVRFEEAPEAEELPEHWRAPGTLEGSAERPLRRRSTPWRWR